MPKLLPVMNIWNIQTYFSPNSVAASVSELLIDNLLLVKAKLVLID